MPESANVGEYVAGVNLGFHDSAACLLRHGALRAMVEQERVSRRKRAIAQSPADALRACLEMEGIGEDDVDILAIGWDFRGTPLGRNKRFTDEGIIRSLLPGRTRPGPVVRWTAHHVAHAASAFHSSGQPEAAVLVVDGAGERTASTIARASGAGVDILREWPIAQFPDFEKALLGSFAGIYPVGVEERP